MSQALYRKYRPKTFSEVEGQEHVVRTIQGALSSGRIGHAYLFCGPRGTGKTTMARLLAKSVNCIDFNPEGTKKSVPCANCLYCKAVDDGNSLDTIEIDAASNRGIDEIRGLKESAMVAAASAKFKVFIVDEVHMLTPPAFNALLKILEEPPSHVIFILATTEPHKVPDTILSRVQRFDFRKISLEQIKEKLNLIAKAENISIETSALAELAVSSSGSLRDAESAFSKVIAYAGRSKSIDSQSVAEILGIVPSQVHETLVGLLLTKKPQEAIKQINDLHDAGVDLNNFLKQFVKYLRLKLISMIGDGPYITAPISLPNQITPEFLVKTINIFVKASNEIKFSPIMELPIELAIFEITKQNG